MAGEPTSETLEPGRRLGHYEIQSRLGSGGMGAVYQARDTRLNRPVAIKILTQHDQDEIGRSRIAREAQAASALNHPNIVTVYEIGCEDGIEFIAMERIDGETLTRLIGRRLPLREALSIAIQIADALAAAHAAGIVHRDLKPGNIMVTGRRLVKVLDFGIAKVTPLGNPETRATQTMATPGQAAGTLAFMSPEQAEGREVDGRSDIFSFGCVLYEMLTAHRAFQQDTDVGTLAAVVAREPMPVSQLVPGLPKSMERILEGCLKKNRAERWQSMMDVKLVLDGALADLDLAAPPRRRFSAASSLTALAAFLLGVAAVWWFTRPAPKPVRAPQLSRVTTTPGLNAYPSLSRDGNLLAYASDQGAGNLDIFVRQLGGRDAVQVTNDPADDTEPSLSPDGAKVAFRSERAGGGIYWAPALGGEAVLLAPRGRRPRYSPDGRSIAYWEGRENRDLLADTARVYIVDAGGGEPHQMATDLRAALYPVWSPQGDSLLVLGRSANDAGPDWWIVPVASGKSVKTGLLDRLAAQGLHRTAWQTSPMALEWSAAGVLVASGTGESANLWEIPVNGSAAQPVTEGPGYQLHGSSAARRLAFSHLDWKPHLETVPLKDANTGATSGPATALTSGDQPESFMPSVTADGRIVVYRRHERAQWAIRAIDDAKSVALVSSPVPIFNPRISGDGTVVAYSDEAGNLFQVPRAGGSVQKLCSGCGTVMGLSRDGRRIAYEPLRDENLMYWDARKNAAVKVAERPADRVLTGAQFSPDGKWITFHARSRNTTAQIFVVPIDGVLPIPRDRWIEVTDGQTEDIEPAWSPNGSLLYFLSDRDGSRCVWARRLDPATRQPAGDAFEVAPFHTARLSLRLLPTGAGYPGLSVAPTRLIFAIGELTGDIWLEEHQP
jgi:serine/threonine protein kinase/Tol biopolymer transport system component